MSEKRLIPDIITPNRLTYLRLVMIPVFMLFFFLNVVPGNYFVAAVVFTLAALTDLADGKIARKYNLVSNLGKFLDPIADKVLVSSAFILLLTIPSLFSCVFWGLNPTTSDVVTNDAGYVIAVVCICVIMARELIISGFRQVAAAAGLVLAAEKLGKYKTTFQDIAIVVLLVALGVFSYNYTVAYFFAFLGFVLLVVATALTIVSGVSYLVKNKAVLKS